MHWWNMGRAYTGEGNDFKHKNFDDFILCVCILCAMKYAFAVGLCVFFLNPVVELFEWSFY
jgi:hypothetical protein